MTNSSTSQSSESAMTGGAGGTPVALGVGTSVSSPIADSITPTPGESATASAPLRQARSTANPRHVIKYKGLEDGLKQMPPYTQSLLKIAVPVIVTLAETRQTVQQVLTIGPGSIIQFNKACDESLILEVGATRLALGEAVKVGEKFGLWITSMILPEERFGPANVIRLKQFSSTKDEA